MAKCECYRYEAADASGSRQAMSALVALARRSATKEVKRQLQGRGLKLEPVPFREIRKRAHLHFTEHHRALLEEALETVRKVPRLRTLYQRELRDRGENRR